MSSEGPLDLAIIGGGAAGTYAAHRLRAAHPEWSISLLEASGRIGGRLLSVIPPGGGGQLAELGGMRFREGHRLVSDAVRSLGLKTRPFSTAHAQNRFYLRGMARTAGDAPEQRGRGYRLEGWERDKTPGELLMAAFERVIPGAVGLSEAELAALIPSREFNGRPLYELSLDDVFAATVSADAHRFVLDSFGYDSGIRPHNAADGIRTCFARLDPTWRTSRPRSTGWNAYRARSPIAFRPMEARSCSVIGSQASTPRPAMRIPCCACSSRAGPRSWPAA